MFSMPSPSSSRALDASRDSGSNPEAAPTKYKHGNEYNELGIKQMNMNMNMKKIYQ